MHNFYMIVVCTLVTMATRFLPFLIFNEHRKTPEIILYLGKVLPCAIMGMLVVYCLKDTAFLSAPFGIPELLGIAVVALAVVILLLPLPAAGAIAALCLIGLGNGAIYPNFIHLTPYNFGKELSQAVMGSQIAFAYIGVMLAPPLVSLVCGLFDMGVYPILLAVLTVVMAVSIAVFARNLKKRGAYDTEV